MPELAVDTFRHAAAHMREFAATATSGPKLAVLAIADMLDAAADDFAWVERHNAIDPDNDGRTRITPHHLAVAALNIARVYLGEVDA